MSKLVLLITDEQKEVLQDVCDVIESALQDERKMYPMQTIGENGTHNYLVTRQEFLEHIMEWTLNTLGANFEFLE